MAATVVLYLLPFFYPAMWITALLALWPMIEMARASRPGAAFLRGYLLGLALFIAGLYWVGHVSVFGLVLLSAIIALYIAIFCWLVARYHGRFRAPFVVAVPALWVAIEFARCNLISPFPWLILGHSQHACLPMIQIADLAGVYGVSFVCALAAAAAAECRRGKRAALKQCLAAFAVLVLVLGYGVWRIQTLPIHDGPRLAIVQGNIPQSVKLQYTYQQSVQAFMKHVKLSRETAAEKPDLIVWPETMCPGFLDLPPANRGETDLLAEMCRVQLKRLARDLKARLLIGYLSVHFKDRKAVLANAVRYYAPNAQVLGKYEKMHLVPFGEYKPFEETIPLLKTYVYPLVEQWCAPIGNLEPGFEQTIFDLKGRQFGVLICYEDVLPYLARGLRRKGADFAINVTNDGWFKDSLELDQHNTISAFRAVENRIGMVRAANTGMSSFISPTGEVYAVLRRQGRHREVEGWCAANVRTCPTRTLYTRVGEAWAWLCVIAAVGLVALPRRMSQPLGTSGT